MVGVGLVLWVFYMLHGWWAIRVEALRPRGNGTHTMSPRRVDSEELMIVVRG